MSAPRVWRYGRQNTLTKPAAESRFFVFDFSRAPELIAGETISAPNVPAVSGLTIGAPAVLAAITDGVAVGKGVAVQLSAGTDGTTYEVECRVTASGGGTLVMRGNLAVE